MQANLIISLMAMLAFGTWGYRIADRRGRNTVIGALVCGFFGLIGVGVYALVTRKPKHVASAMTELAPMP
jgi:hypothetical protein